MKKGMDSKGLIDKMLEDTAKTIDSIKNDIEKTIVDYTFVPGKDIIETDDSIIVRVDLAGIKKENIDLNLTDTKLRVKAEFEDEHIGDLKGNNRRPTLIRRTVRFPKKVVPEESEAKFENGLLTLEVSKLEKKESYTVNIK
ncbi:Hsp20/alpha crystallin family protein [Methanobacterium sp. SMA-27]|uniref:Hsp20/alpha crystallin family protein n=1 Tax=Methanobacterium sp. SMA-27 TaxID=1495336 RepID=UPI000B325246|nr:Hsp20/alpha crystallin family protein [Methanobacterium sp. SMA-27]